MSNLNFDTYASVSTKERTIFYQPTDAWRIMW